MVEVTSHTGNPIDLVEEIVVANDWAHDRASEEEMIVEISGRWCDYRLYFLWQEELSALHFSCGFDMKVPKRRRGPLYELLALANERLWLGHFDLAAGDASPAVDRGVAWLVDTQRPDGTWDESRHTGTGFPGDFYINYHLYRLVYPVMALGRILGAG